MTEQDRIVELERLNAAQTDLLIRQAEQLDILRTRVGDRSKRLRGLQVLAGIASWDDSTI